MPRINIANPSERRWWPNSYLFSFGAYGSTYVLAYGSSLEDALEEAAAWLADNAPGHLMPFGGEEHTDLIKEACHERGIEFDPDKCCGVIEESWDDILQEAEADLTYTESGFLTSYEWTVHENPSKADLIALYRARW